MFKGEFLCFIEGGFPGIYNVLLTDRCWSADGNKVILNTTWRSYKVGVCNLKYFRFKHNSIPSSYVSFVNLAKVC